MVSTATIRARLKNMIQSDSVISAINNIHVFDVAPMAINIALLPLIIITDGNGTYDNRNLGARFIKPTLSFTIALYMQEWNTNPDSYINANGIDAITTGLEDLTRLNHPMIYNGSNLGGVRDAYLTNVTAISARPYPAGTTGKLYVHKQWTYQVIYSRGT